MPETKDVRVLAAVVAKRLGLVPWHEHRDDVLPHVYRQLSLGEYTKKKRKREPEPIETCSICLDDVPNVILAPCGHKCVCASCCRHIDKCPLCRQAVTTIVARVYQ